MLRGHMSKWIMSFLLVFGGVLPVWAGAPTEKIKQTTDKIISIVMDNVLKDPSKAEERRKLIRKAVDERFDWEEMARRSLGTHWGTRSDGERKQFVDLFGQILEKTYLDKVEGYAGEKVVYLGESLEGEYAIVEVRILTTKNAEIPVKYRVKKKGDDWFVYDISIEGVSLVNNYRMQFNNILAKSSYQELVKRLTEKVNQQ